MKKTFTFCLLALLATATAMAQGYRKWDFTQWSATTIGNLQIEAQKGVTGGTWSDTEKADGSNPQVGKCYWSYGDNVIDGELAANGAVIAETSGLIFNTGYTTRRSLAIAVDFPSTSLGDYAGPQYLWLGGGKNKIACFTIPKVRIGQKMTFVVESHKPSEGRGIELYVGSTDDANRIGDSFTPKTQETYTWENWTLPEGATDNGDGTVDVIVYNTNGCHIYSIEVGDNVEKTKVAYMSAGDGDDYIPSILRANEMLDVSVVDVATIPTDDYSAATQFATQLREDNDLLVISPLIPSDHSVAFLAQSALPYMPVLNFNAGLYTRWSYGQTVTTSGFVKITSLGNSLFKNVPYEESDEGNVMVIAKEPYNSTMQAIILGSYFDGDDILGVGLDEGAPVAIHTHNINHNGYIYFPYVSDYTDAAILAIYNAVNILANSKSPITAAPAPTISCEYKDKQTLVTISAAKGLPKPRIFYTTDGFTPSTLGTEYKEPLLLTEACTVKAIVMAEGYEVSDVAEMAVEMKNQTPQPTISMVQEDGKTIVTLSSDIEGATIYYNYDGQRSVLASSPYTQPVTIDIMGRTIYAFAQAEGYVDSEVASQGVVINNPKVRIDVLAHMDANSEEYNGGSTSTSYYFSWGKDKGKYSYWDTSAEPTIVEDPETGEPKEVYPLSPEETKDFENGWMIGSRGQVVIWEKDGYTMNYGDTSGRNPATVDDIDSNFPITKYFITLSEKSNDASVPYNAYIATTEPYTGPFDVVAYVGNGSKPDASKEVQDHQNVVFEVSPDQETWTQLGDTCDVVGPRLFHRFVRSYEGTSAVYLRARLAAYNSKAQFYEIYIANEGEKSKEMMAGISDRRIDSAEVRVAAVYSLNGVRRNGLSSGVNIVRYTDGTARKVVK